MNDNELIFNEERRLMKEIEKEKSFSLKKLFKIFELNALLHS